MVTDSLKQQKKQIKQITILEKEEKVGGLLRSYEINKIFYDVGPHIIFSKNKEFNPASVTFSELNLKVLDDEERRFVNLISWSD